MIFMDLATWAKHLDELSRPLCSEEENSGALHQINLGDWQSVAFGAVMTLLHAGELPDEDRRIAIEFAREGIWFDRKSNQALLRQLAGVAA
jgi:hypothetical protein